VTSSAQMRGGGRSRRARRWPTRRRSPTHSRTPAPKPPCRQGTRTNS
jgi:hypothetical protein